MKIYFLIEIPGEAILQSKVLSIIGRGTLCTDFFFFFHLYNLKNNNSLNQLKKAMGFMKVEPVEVVHCRWAYGLSLVHKSGWKLV